MSKELLNYGFHKLKEVMDKDSAISLSSYLYKYINNIDDYKQGIEQLLNGVPIQYIVGNINFYGYKFEVDSNVLIPRFETEELVDITKKYILTHFNKDIDIADIGTGSGCIAITLKKIFPNSKVSAVDISMNALEVAKKNAQNNLVNIDFYLGDLLSPLNKKYDLIISNPPYLSDDDDIMEIVKNNEPHIALYADNDGLEMYEKILKYAKNYLKEQSMMAFEIGEFQGNKIKNIILKYFPKAKVSVEKDLQNRDRFIFTFIGFE